MSAEKLSAEPEEFPVEPAAGDGFDFRRHRQPGGGPMAHKRGASLTAHRSAPTVPLPRLVAHNYEEQGKSVVIMTSAIDTRDGVGVVSSRIGMKREAVAIEEETDIFGFIKNQAIKPYCVLIDEAHF